MIIDEGIDDQKDESLLAQMRPSMNMKKPQKNLNFYLLWLLRYDYHKFVPVHALIVIDAH